MTTSMSQVPVAPRLGVVTVTFNSAPFLAEFFASSWSQSLAAFRLYAVDNASRDATAQALSGESDPRLRIVLNSRNAGVAEGNNQGIVQALADGCEWVLLLNNDTSFSPTLFAELIEGAQAYDWKVVVPKIHFDEPAGHIWYGGGGFNPRRGHTGYHTGIGAPDHAQFDASKTVDYSPTCSMLVHRSVFEQIGLMDETYFVYFDDTDFCWRLRQAGIPIGYWPRASLVHKVGGSTGGSSSPFSAGMTARNRLYFLRKHFGALSPVAWLPVFLPYYAVRYLLRSWNPQSFRASLRGSFSYRTMVERTPRIDASASRRSTR